ncbi:rhamnogalacturonan lyase [Streptomyces sp. NPDC088746]|uniref:rhamnogalacturonan lyase n=1 Tax=Streptomyces sp. NPDC088746 TaxID=3365885 RepID=UPI00381F6934
MKVRRWAVALLAGVLAVGTGVDAQAARSGHAGQGAGDAQLERLDRGLVAVSSAEGVFLSWRLLGSEVTGHTDTGLAGADFRVYRDGRPIATVTDSTNYLDRQGASDAEYRVAAIVDGREARRGDPVSPWADGFYDLPLRKPAGGVTPAGEAYTYSANDMSVGDVDGDGRYEYVVKWDPSNSKDVSQAGYTGRTYIDTYRLDGTLLNRIDLGPNIRAGAHYTQFLVYDFDGDGRSEMMFKTAPGTRSIRYRADGSVASERYITMPRADVRAGYAHTDDYRLSAADYRDHLVGMFRDWQQHPEVAAGDWPATLESAFGIEDRYAYPLSRADAEALADHFIDVYAPSRSTRNNLRAFEGFILDGPEYLTVFDGATGRELDTVRYEPGRHDDGLMWGDYAMSRIEPGNRVDRFLSGVAYLDGRHPSAVFARGYYTRTTLAAYRWDGRSLRKDWDVDSGFTPMSNPFNDSPHGVDGTDPEFGTLTTQGFHSLSAADVDGDGRQEIVYGSATIDDDGTLLYSSSGTMPPQSPAPGRDARLGHGDAMHVTDIDPDHPGMEIYTVHEGGTSAPYGYALRDAATGEVLYGAYSGRDTGRGMVGDVDPSHPGLETWASMPGGSDGSGLWTAAGEPVGTATPGTNMSIRWAGDLTTQLVDGSGDATPTVNDWRRGTRLTATDTRTGNGTKGNPSLVADVLGDWREEMLVRTADSSAIRMYLSTELTGHKMYTLMHDAQYRAEVARQQTAYNQPAYPGFYLASDTDWSEVPLPGRRR